MVEFILLFCFAIFTSIIGLYLFNKFKILDNPGPDVPPRKRVPTVQGVILIIGIILSFFIFYPQYISSKVVVGLFSGGLLLAIVALIDNFYHINPLIRLLVQITSAIIAFFVGVGFNHIYLQGELFQIPFVIAFVLTIFWFVFFINSINWFDGINGLASGLLSIGFLSIILLLKFVVIPAYPNMTQEELERLLFTIDISMIFFVFSLVYTFVELKPFGLLRDIGIMFLAYGLAFLSLLGGAKIGTILVVLSLVLLDAIWVFFWRIFKMKKNPMKGDYTHLHYRLLKLGWSRNEVKVFIIGWAVFWMIIILLQKSNTFNKIIIFLLMIILFFGVNFYLYFIKGKEAEYIRKNKLK